MAGIYHAEGAEFLNNNLETRDKQHQAVDSSEQYAINALGDGAIKTADKVMKVSKKAIERAKLHPQAIHSQPSNRSQGCSVNQVSAETPISQQTLHIQIETVRHAPSNGQKRQAVVGIKNVPEQVSESTQGSGLQISSTVGSSTTPPEDTRPLIFGNVKSEATEPSIRPDVSGDNTFALPDNQGEFPINPDAEVPYPKPQSNPFPHGEQITSISSTHKNYTASHSTTGRTTVPHLKPEGSVVHNTPSDNALYVSREVHLNTWIDDPLASSLQNQGAALSAAENSGTALQSAQAVSQTAGSAGASVTANTTAPGMGAAIQVAEKVVSKAKETIENIAASAPRSTSTWGALAALFLMPLLFLMAIAGVLRGGGSARNMGLSDDVIALMPQISAACQANGIPEYAPLVAAVIMQESGGRVADVGGDVMQCAEGMGLPVGTPVSLEESINFGTNIIANNLQLAGAAGPTDIPAISLALQGYNFGSGYISWAQSRGGYSKENAREFSEMQAAAHGWSGYGDIDYVDHVLRYYQVSVGGMGDASTIADGRFAYPFPGHTWDTYPGHNGIDISFANCYGEPVYAVADGTVRYTQDGWTSANGVGGMWSFGNSVFVEHGDGWISAYGHLSALAVAQGEYVTQGQLVGYVGSTGNSTGPHLHLALYHNGDAGIVSQNFAELAWPQYRG